MKTINCSIITIGDELLIGQTIDTNSAWIGQQLNTQGIWVKRRVAVGDVKEDIWDALDQESEIADIIIITGGLGPTADDITKPLLCEYFEATLILNQQILDHVTAIFAARKRPMLDVNIKQAMVPDNCTVLFNEVGTAAGMWFEKNNTIYISLPGVPFEMQHLISTKVIPKLKNHFITPNILHRTLVTIGEGESFIADRLIDFETELPSSIKLAYLPKLGMVKLRLTAADIPAKIIDEQFDRLKNLLSNIMFADKDQALEEVVSQLLHIRQSTVSFAESCTGGALAARITSIKGASNIFKGAIVTYTVESKINTLNIDSTLLEKYTAISEEVVKEMAEHCRKKFNSTYSVSISGHLEKQAADTFVWIGLAKEGKTIAKKMYLFSDRSKNGVMVCNQALNLLRLFILK